MNHPVIEVSFTIFFIAFTLILIKHVPTVEMKLALFAFLLCILIGALYILIRRRTENEIDETQFYADQGDDERAEQEETEIIFEGEHACLD